MRDSKDNTLIIVMIFIIIFTGLVYFGNIERHDKSYIDEFKSAYRKDVDSILRIHTKSLIDNIKQTDSLITVIELKLKTTNYELNQIKQKYDDKKKHIEKLPKDSIVYYYYEYISDKSTKR